MQVLPLTDRLPVNSNPYMAISWRWNSDLPRGQGAASHRYRFQRPKEQPCHSKVPNIYFDRAIHFTKAHGIDSIWIDNECIYQKNEKDKTTGIQGTDLVYRGCELSFSLLDVELQSQQQLKALSDLLSLKFVDESFEEPRFKSWVHDGLSTRILNILRLIHCASFKMISLFGMHRLGIKTTKTSEIYQVSFKLRVPSSARQSPSFA